MGAKKRSGKSRVSRSSSSKSATTTRRRRSKSRERGGNGKVAKRSKSPMKRTMKDKTVDPIGRPTFTCACHCGKVHVEAVGLPEWKAWYHARALRTLHGAPMVALAGYTAEDVSFKRGASNVISCESGKGSCAVMTCKTCGAGMLADIYGVGTAIYVQSLECHRGAGTPYDQRFAPDAHYYYSEGSVSSFDGLDKYSDLPVDLGGSGCRVADGIHGHSKPSEARDCALEFSGLLNAGLDAYERATKKRYPFLNLSIRSKQHVHAVRCK